MEEETIVVDEVVMEMDDLQDEMKGKTATQNVDLLVAQIRREKILRYAAENRADRHEWLAVGTSVSFVLFWTPLCVFTYAGFAIASWDALSTTETPKKITRLLNAVNCIPFFGHAVTFWLEAIQTTVKTKKQKIWAVGYAVLAFSMLVLCFAHLLLALLGWRYWTIIAGVEVTITLIMSICCVVKLGKLLPLPRWWSGFYCVWVLASVVVSGLILCKYLDSCFWEKK